VPQIEVTDCSYLADSGDKDSALWRSNEVIALVRKSISQKSFIIFD